MKFLHVLLAIFVVGSISAQDFPFSGAKKVSYVGILFSEAEFVGHHGFTDPQAIKDKYLKGWNDLMVNESNKYDLRGALHIHKFEFKHHVAAKTYPDVDVPSKVVEYEESFGEKNMKDAIDKLDLQNLDSDLGLCWIVQSFNKNEGHARIWLVAFDIKSKEIVWKHDFVEKPGGFGIRNYWASCFYKAINRIKNTLYETWTY